MSAITIDEFDEKTYAVLAGAAKAIVRIAKPSHLLHYSIVWDLRNISNDIRSILEMLHTAPVMSALESADPNDLERISGRLVEVQSKNDRLIKRIEGARLGYWSRIYGRQLATLAALNEELSCHASILASENPAILFSRNDQGRLIELLENPPEPSEALRNAINR